MFRRLKQRAMGVADHADATLTKADQAIDNADQALQKTLKEGVEILRDVAKDLVELIDRIEEKGIEFELDVAGKPLPVKLRVKPTESVQ